MAEQDRTDAPDTGRAEAGGDTSGGVVAGVAAPGPQSIESTTAALGDMEPSAGSGGASEAETDGDKT